MEIDVILLIVGLVSLILCYPVFNYLEKREYRWSRVVLIILLAIGIFSLGIFAEI